MSLTRDEWIEMWNSTNRLQRIANEVDMLATHSGPRLCRRMEAEIDFLKEKIQQVIGQME